MILSIILVSLSGCTKTDTSSFTESWIEWEEEVPVEDDDSNANSNENNSANNSKTEKPADTGSNTQKVEVVADERYFPSDWLKAREQYEKNNPPYNVPSKLKGTTVTFATWMDHTKTEGAHAWKTFEEQTGIKIKWVNIPQSEYVPKLAAMMASQQSPDVFVENNEFFPQTLEIAQPLNKISTIDINDPIWDQSVIKASTYGKNFYFINTKYSIWNGGDSVYYNKKAFEDNGLLTPQDYIDAGQWTMDNLIKVMTEFKALNSSYTGGHVVPSYLTSALGSSIVYQKNGKFVSGINDSAFTEGFRIYNKMKEAKLLGGTEKGFMDGTCGIYIVGTMGLKRAGVFAKMDPDNLGVAPIPSIDGKSTPYTSAIFRSYGICRGAKNPEGAAYFLRYFLDPFNYDYDTVFMNEELRDYFVNNISGISADKKFFDYSGCSAVMFGYATLERNTWRNALANAEPAQFNVELQKISNEVNAAVKKCNQIIDKVIAQDK